MRVAATIGSSAVSADPRQLRRVQRHTIASEDTPLIDCRQDAQIDALAGVVVLRVDFSVFVIFQKTLQGSSYKASAQHNISERFAGESHSMLA